MVIVYGNEDSRIAVSLVWSARGNAVLGKPVLHEGRWKQSAECGDPEKHLSRDVCKVAGPGGLSSREQSRLKTNVGITSKRKIKSQE